MALLCLRKSAFPMLVQYFIYLSKATWKAEARRQSRSNWARQENKQRSITKRSSYTKYRNFFVLAYDISCMKLALKHIYSTLFAFLAHVLGFLEEHRPQKGCPTLSQKAFLAHELFRGSTGNVSRTTVKYWAHLNFPYYLEMFHGSTGSCSSLFFSHSTRKPTWNCSWFSS
jgi:hypothetical protein